MRARWCAVRQRGIRCLSPRPEGRGRRDESCRARVESRRVRCERPLAIGVPDVLSGEARPLRVHGRRHEGGKQGRGERWGLISPCHSMTDAISNFPPCWAETCMSASRESTLTRCAAWPLFALGLLLLACRGVLLRPCLLPPPLPVAGLLHVGLEHGIHRHVHTIHCIAPTILKAGKDPCAIVTCHVKLPRCTCLPSRDLGPVHS